jgi:hypothetical protein
MIAGIVTGCYAAAWLLTARLLYGRWRGEWQNYRGQYSLPSYVAAAVMAIAVVWPLVWCAALVMFRPPPTAAERATAEARLKARVAELEREAGITPK